MMVSHFSRTLATLSNSLMGPVKSLWTPFAAVSSCSNVALGGIGIVTSLLTHARRMSSMASGDSARVIRITATGTIEDHRPERPHATSHASSNWLAFTNHTITAL